jgi:hypothetical protein
VENQINKFFAVARERYNILLKRRAGLPKPWSDDPIFRTEYFCNVFREDDRTTMWFRENIRDKLRNDPKEALAAIAAFRWFNKIETGEKIKEFLLGDWDHVKVYNKLSNVKPVVTGAYIIKTPDGMTKLKGVLWCIEEFNKLLLGGTFDKILQGKATMEESCGLLKTAPYLGNFMAWQICSDARQTCLLENATDSDTWAQAGPGSTRGIGRVYYNDVDKFAYGGKNEVLILMQDLCIRSRDTKYWNPEYPKLTTMDISHQLCEFDKYERCQEGGRMKRKYGNN